MGKFLKEKKAVIILSGRYAGKKAIIVKQFDEGWVLRFLTYVYLQRYLYMCRVRVHSPARFFVYKYTSQVLHCACRNPSLASLPSPPQIAFNFLTLGCRFLDALLNLNGLTGTPSGLTDTPLLPVSSVSRSRWQRLCPPKQSQSGRRSSLLLRLLTTTTWCQLVTLWIFLLTKPLLSRDAWRMRYVNISSWWFHSCTCRTFYLNFIYLCLSFSSSSFPSSPSSFIGLISGRVIDVCACAYLDVDVDVDVNEEGD